MPFRAIAPAVRTVEFGLINTAAERFFLWEGGGWVGVSIKILFFLLK